MQTISSGLTEQEAYELADFLLALETAKWGRDGTVEYIEFLVDETKNFAGMVAGGESDAHSKSSA